MKGITYCGACADYDIKKHRCKRGAKLESNPQDKFFDDCPLPDAAPVGLWISAKDKLPEAEAEVLAVCNRNGFRFVVPAIYEDGTVLSQDSMWNWYELDAYGTYSEENDDYFVPDGWWENRQFTPDDVYNNPVDCVVTHWMPLPEPPKGARMDGDSDALD